LPSVRADSSVKESSLQSQEIEKKARKKKATWKSKSLFLFGGRWRFRTSDPSSVNAVLYP
jgi:hypothetical protein